MKQSMTLAATLVAAFTVTACGGPDRMERAEQRAELERFELEKKAERKAMANEYAEDTIEEYPEWAMQEGAQAGPNGISAIGQASGATPLLAMRKARLKAEFGLAARFDQALSGGERLREEEQNGQVRQDYELLIERLVDDVPIVGYREERKEIRAIGGQPMAFIELHMDYDDYEKALRARQESMEDARTEEAFSDLQERLDAYRARKAGDAEE